MLEIVIIYIYIYIHQIYACVCYPFNHHSNILMTSLTLLCNPFEAASLLVSLLAIYATKSRSTTNTGVISFEAAN